jgi:hypothetical protein
MLIVDSNYHNNQPTHAYGVGITPIIELLCGTYCFTFYKCSTWNVFVKCGLVRGRGEVEGKVVGFWGYGGRVLG